MLKFNESSEKSRVLQERGIEYTIISPKEAYGMLLDWVKKNNGYRVFLHFPGSDRTEMDAIYNKVKIEGQRIALSHTSSPYNCFSLCPKDIVKAEFAEDKEAGYMSFNFVLQSKQMAHIMPFNKY